MSNKWFNRDILSGPSTYHNRHAILGPTNVDSMSLLMDDILDTWKFGDYTKWCSSLIMYPFCPVGDMSDSIKYPWGPLKINNIFTQIGNCYKFTDNIYWGYSLGEYYYVPYVEDYSGYEPYTQLQAYLPYYGFVDIPIAAVAYKYIQFRLIVDFDSGDAQYIIGVNNKSVCPPDTEGLPMLDNVDDSDTRILSVVGFTIGYNIPLGQTGNAERMRNLYLGAIKMASGVAGVMAGINTGTFAPVSTGTHNISSVQTYSTRNPNTGRMVKRFVDRTDTTETTEHRGDVSGLGTRTLYNSCVDASAYAIANANLHPHTDHVNNSVVNRYACRNVKLIEKRVKFKAYNPTSYGYLYGYPCGKITQLKNMSGYTELSNFHIEGEHFKSATQEELVMLENALGGGIIM